MLIIGGIMIENDLKKLTRRELLELLVMQSKKIDRLQAELDEKQKQLSNRDLKIRESGSIAEASILINNVLANAQTAADQYLENVHNLHADTERECKKLREEAEAECREMKKKAKEEVERYISEKKQMIDNGVQLYIEELKRLADTIFNRDQPKLFCGGNDEEE